MSLPIGGFMPIPLAMMIPFMATQSMVMGDAFGRAFQYGKRKISAMSNEEFNATSLEQQASEMFKAYKIIIGENHLERAMQESQKLQETIIREMLLILPRFATSSALHDPIPFEVNDAKTIQDALAHLAGTHIHPEATTTLPPSTLPPERPTTIPTTSTTTSSGKITLQESNKLRLQYSQTIQQLQTALKTAKSRLVQASKSEMRFKNGQNVRHYFASPSDRLKAQQAVTTIEKEITQQKLFLSRVNRLEAPF